MSISPVPFTAQISGLVPQAWSSWFTGVKTAIDAAALLVGSVALTAQGASIGGTPIPTPRLSAGLYRVSYYARITRTATTSSSLTVLFGWTESGIALGATLAAIVGNTTGTTQTGTLLLRIDDNTTINYATTYASVGATSMQYRVDFVLEKVPA